MEAGNEGLAEELVRVAGFATQWLRGRQPAPLHGWEFAAMPSLFAVEVRDAAGNRVALPGAARFETATAGFWQIPAPDGSGVVPGGLGVWYQWADDPRWPRPARTGQAPSSPRSTDLHVTYRADPRVRLCFTFDPPQLKDSAGHPVRQWISAPRGMDAGVESPFGSDNPAFRPAASQIPGLPRFDTDLPAPPEVARLAGPGAHRAGSGRRPGAPHAGAASS